MGESTQTTTGHNRLRMVKSWSENADRPAAAVASCTRSMTIGGGTGSHSFLGIGAMWVVLIVDIALGEILIHQVGRAPPHFVSAMSPFPLIIAGFDRCSSPCWRDAHRTRPGPLQCYQCNFAIHSLVSIGEPLNPDSVILPLKSAS
jgi:hypothetical protein